MLGVVTGLAFEARDLRRGWEQGAPPTHTGVGRAAGTAAEALMAAGARGLIGFGLAGGLDDEWSPGRVIVAAEVLGEGELWRLPSASAFATKLNATAARLYTSAAPLLDGAAKRAAQVCTGAVAVDMESAHVLRAAAAAGAGVVVVRVIADPAHRRLPRLALVAVDAAGRLKPAGVIAALARYPADWSAVVLSARDTARARNGLRRAAAGLAGLARQGLLEGFLDVPLEDVGRRPLV